MNLLDDPLLRVTGGAAPRLSLPDLLAALSTGEDLRAAALRPHQQNAWHLFLVQLAALVYHRRRTPPTPLAPAAWRSSLLELAGPNAWSFVVDALSQPALLQPPVPEGTLDSFAPVEYPDDLDLTVTAKAHDLKPSLLADAEPDLWLYALLNLQTQQGYSGATLYGIARMNGGFGSRPYLGLLPSLAPAAHWRHDVDLWLEHRAEMLERAPWGDDGAPLLWTLPWDGTKSHALSLADPFAIEVCRRIRLVSHRGRLLAYTRGTKKPFLDAKSFLGDLGDPHLPIGRAGKNTKALTLGAPGFRPRQIVSYLFDDSTWIYKPSLLPSTATDHTLLARTLVRGQGKTQGYHELRLPLPEPVITHLMDPETRARALEIATSHLDLIATIRHRLLTPPLLLALQGQPERLNIRDPRARPWLEPFSRRASESFFPFLWPALDTPDEGLEAWSRHLLHLASDELHRLLPALPTSSRNAPATRNAARFFFRNLAEKHFPGLLASQDVPVSQDTTPA